MSAFVRKFPALSLGMLAMILGLAPVVAVGAGLLPPAADQLGALSASLAGIILAAVEGRKGGVRELLGRLLIWRVGIQWWAFALLFPIIPSVAALYLYDLSGGPPVDWSGLRPIYTVIPMILFFTVAAGIGEEFGWRGFALPRLQARHNALVSSLIVGGFWAAWHVPLFFVEGTSQFSFRTDVGLLPAVAAYSVFVVAGAIQAGWIFNNTKGSVLLAAVYHGAGNAWVGGYIDVYRGHFGGLLTFAALTILISAVIVLAAGPANLSRTEERNVLKSVDANQAAPTLEASPEYRR